MGKAEDTYVCKSKHLEDKFRKIIERHGPIYLTMAFEEYVWRELRYILAFKQCCYNHRNVLIITVARTSKETFNIHN